MKKKIKTWLIHLLGGVTVAENIKKNGINFLLGMKGACIDIRDYAEPRCADVWSFTDHASEYAQLYRLITRRL